MHTRYFTARSRPPPADGRRRQRSRRGSVGRQGRRRSRVGDWHLHCEEGVVGDVLVEAVSGGLSEESRVRVGAEHLRARGDGAISGRSRGAIGEISGRCQGPLGAISGPSRVGLAPRAHAVRGTIRGHIHGAKYCIILILAE